MDNKRKAFTLIELIMVIVIIGILSVSGAYLLSAVLQNSSYVPSQLNTDMIAADALDIMIEGDAQARGLRFSKDISNIQDNEITFKNQDDVTIRYHLDIADNKLYRSINGGPDELIPYYVPAGVELLGENNRVFTYLDANENETIDPNTVKMVRINFLTWSGDGQFEKWEGLSQLASAVTVKRYPNIAPGPGPGAGPPGPGETCWPPRNCNLENCGNGRCRGSENCSNCPSDCGICVPGCGDGICNGAETCDDCPIDCGDCPPRCGNGRCQRDETCITCPGDCGICPMCGDVQCNGYDTCSNCPQDCGTCAPVCGDGQCNGTETCDTCAADCGICPPSCGDRRCNGLESCETCDADCGRCRRCGDGNCQGSESCNTCPSDCGSCTPVCGDGQCNGSETCSTCSQDCGNCDCGDGRCRANRGETCITCSQDCGSCPVCGDDICHLSETCSNCRRDCGRCP